MDNNLDPIPLTYEDILHEVFDLSSQGFQVIGRDWQYLFVNDAVARQGKRPAAELIGHTMMEMYPGIDQTPLFVQLKRCMEERVSIRMENEFDYPDKSKGWFQLFIHPWANGIIIFSVDITEKKLAEEELLRKINELDSSTQNQEVKMKVAELKQALTQLRQQAPVVMPNISGM